MDTVPAYVDWRACTATPLSGVSRLKVSLKLPPRVTWQTVFVPEAEFLEVIGTKVLRVFLLAFHSRLY